MFQQKQQLYRRGDAGNLTWLEMGTYIKIWLHWTDRGHVKDVRGEGLGPIQARIYELANIPANNLGLEEDRHG